jgi:HTH-type transcriptional regulator, sugar sensing transcriptional regulator
MAISNKRKIYELLDLGLSEREAKVYMALLEKKGFTIRELQTSVSIPRSKIYEVLRKMILRGICTERIIGKLKYYEAVEPKLAFNRILEEYNEEYREEFEKRKEMITTLTSSLYPIFEKNKDIVSPFDFVEIYKDSKQIQKKYVQTLKSTKFDFLIFNKGPYICNTPKRLGEQEREEKKLIRRKVLCRNIYEKHELETYGWLHKYIKHQVSLGQQARVTETLPIKMIVCDEKMVIFPLLQTIGESNNITMIFIEHHELAVACKMLFNIIWDNAKDVKSSSNKDIKSSLS